MRATAAFTLTLVLCYAVDWAPRYVAASWPSELNLEANITRFRQNCSQAPLQKMSCTDSFAIPAAFLANKGDVVGLGIFISATEIYCRNVPNRVIRFGSRLNASQALDLLKTYQAVDLDVLNCGDDDLVVDVWGPREYRRSGYVGGPLVVGSRPAVWQVRKTVEFFTVQYHYLLAIALLCCLLITRLVLGPVLTVASVSGRRQFRNHSVSWTSFAIVKSGLIELLVPVLGGGFFFIRFANFVSSIAHLSPGLSALAEGQMPFPKFRRAATFLTSPFPRLRWVTPLQVLILIIVAGPYFARWLSTMTLLCVPFYLMAAYGSRRLGYVYFGISALLETCKLSNVPGMPYGSTTLTFATTIILAEFLSAITQGARTAELLTWIRGVGVTRSRDEALSLLEQFGAKFDVGRISLIEPREGGSCSVTIMQRTTGQWERELLFRERMPSVFSHVLTVREPLWHVDEESHLAGDLRKGDEPKRIGRLFSAIPILKDGIPAGALGLTSYPETFFQNRMRGQELRLAVQYLVESLTQVLWADRVSRSDEWYRRCATAGREILAMAESDAGNDFDTALSEIARLVSERTDSKVFMARVDPISRRYDLKVTEGFSAEVDRMYQETQFFALQGNVQGPMPLAINSGKIVTVADLSWLFPVLHPQSLAILKKSDCRSAAAVPILTKSSAEEETVWGLIWMESENVGAFGPSNEAGLQLLSSAIGSFISSRALRFSAVAAISSLTRRDVAERLLKGQDVRESDTGYLLVADVRGSTKIANQLGADAWISFVERLRPVVAALAEKSGLRLQLVVWDAFYFTLSCNEMDSKAFAATVTFGAQLENLLKVALEGLDSSVAMNEKNVARFCLEFGDITRDIRNGSWTITGSSMSRVAKLESVCKKLAGWFYCSENLPFDAFRFDRLEEVSPATNLRIVSLAPLKGRALLPDEIEALVSGYEDKKAA